jgi:hypothetical protein
MMFGKYFGNYNSGDENTLGTKLPGLLYPRESESREVSFIYLSNIA